jgi:hypothetical protein
MLEGNIFKLVLKSLIWSQDILTVFSHVLEIHDLIIFSALFKFLFVYQNPMIIFKLAVLL